MKMNQIGLAKAVGVHVSAIQRWRLRGLIFADGGGPSGRDLQFSKATLQRARRIQALRQQGLSIKVIEALIGDFVDVGRG